MQAYYRFTDESRGKIMLTQRQKAVLDFIKSYITQHGVSPTLTEIDKKFELGSSSAAYQHVQALQRKGYLKKLPFQARSISLLEKEPDAQEIYLRGRIALGKPIESIADPEPIKVPKLLLSGTGHHYALEAVGDSMNEDGINDGDILIIQETYSPQNGDVVVAQNSDYEATLKRFYDNGNKIELRPKSTNSEHKPQFYNYGEIEVQGKLCGLLRRTI